jgi:protein-S-isoprenylcysteine O-methyltransferase Ste14
MRIILLGPILTILAVSLYGLLHSLLASRSAKSWAEQSFGPVAGRVYRLIFNALGLLTFLPVLMIPVFLPGQIIYQLSGIGLILSTLGQAVSVIILVLGLLQTDPWQFIGLRQIIHQPVDGEQRLVISGLYRCVRHPLYLAGLLFIWLIPVMTTSILALNLSLSIYIYIGSLFEERRLQAEFGSSYSEYRARVPRMIPRFRKCFLQQS